MTLKSFARTVDNPFMAIHKFSHRRLVHAFFAGILLLSGTGSACSQVSRDEQVMLDVERARFADEYERLLAGEREFAVVISESHTPVVRGVAVLMADMGNGPLSFSGVAPIAPHLNDQGWVTMSVAPPYGELYQARSQTDESANESAAEGAQQETTERQASEQEAPADNTQTPTPAQSPHARDGHQRFAPEAVEAYEQALMMQMQAIATRSGAYPGFFLVVARGTSAAWLTKLYAENRLPPPDALITVGAFWADQTLNNRLPELMATTPMPLLDLHSAQDSGWSRFTVEERQIAARKNLKLHYRQRDLVGQLSGEAQYVQLGREIHGWLTSMGW